MADDDRRFWQGGLAGFAAAAVLVHAWLAVVVAPMRGMYADFGGTLPATTRVVLAPAWRWGVPVVGAVVLAGLVLRRPRGWAPYLALAIALVATATATWTFAQAPLHELAGNIRAD